MTFPLRRSRLAAAAFLALTGLAAQAQTEPPAPAAPTSPAPIIEPAAPVVTPAASGGADKSPAQPSAMTAELFYEVLMGELTARSGDPGAGYGLVLDAARRSRDSKLFQRAVEIALQSRSGDAALAAARAWKESVPDSREARRFELQILIALNRIGETVEPLRTEVAATPQVERPFLMAVIARNYGRATDKKLAASVVEQALAEDLKSPATGGAAWGTVGRLRLAAGDTAGALDAAIKGQELDPSSDGPALLALELMDPSQPLAEPIVKRYLSGPKAQPEMRMAYARVLVEGRRYAEATAELAALTAARPELPEPWLLLGSLQVQARQDAAADASLRRYMSLASSQRDPDAQERGLTQAYLLMAQLSERKKDFAGADSWLARIDNTDDLVVAQVRRAALLARQGKLPQARELVRSLPDRTADEKKQKFLAEVQLLRDAKQYQAAFDMLAQASVAAPADTDLIYDQAMVAEKLNRLDEMERLLRRLIELKPDNQNAYNALGYSFADRKVRLEEARTLIQKAVQLAPDDPFIADSLGWVEYRLGNTGEAMRILEDAYKRRPDPEIGAHLGEVLWATGQRDRAMTIWKEASLADADNETLQETLKRLRVKL
ncbi:tetratricopeptide repeat protein [Variovorax sp. J22P240]|uniref:tetratricopeptide repeat protein n=1 Tax=Variovorax sp. J22P240 TaxID=3053514 RepID=UPI0025754E79|nr:tetratricopeptide repeat protein [Variovorax sp. J22P240]MDL9999834.1 tetratricopeptide repeat protein [Variovorax sp. J22P240]